MISSLTNSLRVRALYNAAVNSPIGFKIPLRDIHLHQPLLKSLEEKLGLPAKPKKPSSPYFRFMNEMRPTLQAKNPKLKPTELVVTLSKMWKTVDAVKKEQLSQAYEEDMAKYSVQLARYKSNLSKEDIEKIEEAKFGKKERKSVLSQQKKCRDLGKPRKPPSSFLRFLQLQSDRQPQEKYIDFVKRVGLRWQALSDDQKLKYRVSEEIEEKYRNELQKWEAKMRNLGHYDIVSSEPAEITGKPRSRKDIVSSEPAEITRKPRSRKSSTE